MRKVIKKRVEILQFSHSLVVMENSFISGGPNCTIYEYIISHYVPFFFVPRLFSVLGSIPGDCTGKQKYSLS